MVALADGAGLSSWYFGGPVTTLVTGGTGLIGSAIVRQLVERGDTVRVLVRPDSDTRNLDGLDVDPAVMDDILSVDKDEWLAELDGQAEFFAKIGEHLPPEITAQLEAARGRVR